MADEERERLVKALEKAWGIECAADRALDAATAARKAAAAALRDYDARQPRGGDERTHYA